MAPAPVTMLTFGPMIDSETARQLLRLYQVPFVEERHLFGWASILSLIRAGNIRIPVTYGPGLVLAGSKAVADHYEPLAPDALKLVPADPTLRQQVEADWEAFNGQLAGPVAVVAYYHLLPQVAPMVACFSKGVEPGEAEQTARWYGVLRGLFNLLLQLNPTHVSQALDSVRKTIDQLDERVADGRRFVTGERFTLSDVALGCCMAPLTLPDRYAAPVPAFADMPPALQAIVTEFRQRPSAQLVERIYERLAQAG